MHFDISSFMLVKPAIARLSPTTMTALIAWPVSRSANRSFICTTAPRESGISSNLCSAEQTMHWFAQIGGDDDPLTLSGMQVWSVCADNRLSALCGTLHGVVASFPTASREPARDCASAEIVSQPISAFMRRTFNKYFRYREDNCDIIKDCLLIRSNLQFEIRTTDIDAAVGRTNIPHISVPYLVFM